MSSILSSITFITTHKVYCRYGLEKGLKLNGLKMFCALIPTLVEITGEIGSRGGGSFFVFSAPHVCVVLKADLAKISNWFYQRKMSINPGGK